MDQSTILAVLATVVGGGGLSAAIAALFKLPSERGNTAVAQFSGAAAEWKQIAQEYEEQRDYWRDRALRCERAHGEPELTPPDQT